MTDFNNVKNCWAKIKTEKGINLFINYFYQTFFNNYPEVRELFPKDIENQKRALLSMLDNVINGIEYVTTIRSELLDLGRRHKIIGITHEMFDAYIITIVDAAHFASNSSLTQEESTAWQNAFREMSDIMLEAY